MMFFIILSFLFSFNLRHFVQLDNVLDRYFHSREHACEIGIEKFVNKQEISNCVLERIDYSVRDRNDSTLPKSICLLLGESELLCD